MMLSDGLPATVYELTAVLAWAKMRYNPNSPTKIDKSFLDKPWIRRSADDAFVFFIGTRKFSTGTRELLLDSPSVQAIRRSLIDSHVLPPETPLPASHASSSYTNLSLCPISGKKKLVAKLVLLRRSNVKRVRLVKEREGMMLDAKRVMEAGGRGREEVVSVCVGVYEKGKKRRKVIEIGCSKWVVGDDEGRIATTHWVVQEHLGVRNGTFVPDRTDAFAFGTSQVLPYATARAALLTALSPSSGHLSFISNAIHHPIAVLDLSYHLSAFQAKQWDIGKLFRAERKDQGVKSTLRDMLEAYDLPFEPELIHNAGNDSRYVLKVFQALTAAEGRR